MRPLEDIIEDYEELRESYKSFRVNTEMDEKPLLEYQSRFIDLKADLRPWVNKMVAEYTKRDDKAATAIKYRISVAMMKDNYIPKNGVPIYDKPPSVSHADKFAAASTEYKEFLEQRVFYKESYTNVLSLRDDLTEYINSTKQYLR